MLSEMGPAKLLAKEQDRIREAADALIFCPDLSADRAAMRAFADVCELGDHLIESERWTPESADRLVADVWSCGPQTDSWLAAAA
jgi:hypothetical protein